MFGEINNRLIEYSIELGENFLLEEILLFKQPYLWSYRPLHPLPLAGAFWF
jgi:hypothetical protein